MIQDYRDILFIGFISLTVLFFFAFLIGSPNYRPHDYNMVCSDYSC